MLNKNRPRCLRFLSNDFRKTYDFSKIFKLPQGVDASVDTPIQHSKPHCNCINCELSALVLFNDKNKSFPLIATY